MFSGRILDVSARDLLFYTAFGIWLCFRILNTSLYSGYFPEYATEVVFGLVGGLLLLGELSYNSFGRATLYFGLLSILAVAVARETGSPGVLEVVAFVYAARGMDFNRIARLSVVLTSVVLAVVVASAYLGIVDNYVWEFASRSPRYGLGFRLYSYVGHYFLNIVLLIIYLRKKMSVGIGLALTLLNLGIFWLTDSRNSCILVLVALGITVLIQNGGFADSLSTRKLELLSFWPFVVFPLSSYWLVASFNPAVAWQRRLDGMLSGRLTFISRSLDWFGLSLLGSRNNSRQNSLTADGVLATQVGTFDSFVIDNSFMLLLILSGIPVFLVTIYFFLRLGRVAALQKDWKVAVILFVIAIHSLFDPQLLSLHYNTFLLMFSTYGTLSGSKGSLERGGDVGGRDASAHRPQYEGGCTGGGDAGCAEELLLASGVRGR